MKIFCISVSIASANASVLNALFMVFFEFYSGKHKDHDVKTIKKAHPVIKAELENNIDKF